MMQHRRRGYHVESLFVQSHIADIPFDPRPDPAILRGDPLHGTIQHIGTQVEQSQLDLRELSQNTQSIIPRAAPDITSRPCLRGHRLDRLLHQIRDQHRIHDRILTGLDIGKTLHILIKLLSQFLRGKLSHKINYCFLCFLQISHF